MNIVFHIPENIVEIYEPMRHHKQISEIQVKLFQQKHPFSFGDMLTQHYDWEPLPPFTVIEAEWFIENELGMVKAELDEMAENANQEYLSRCSGRKYVCTYRFPTIEARNRWALKGEIENFKFSEK